MAEILIVQGKADTADSLSPALIADGHRVRTEPHARALDGCVHALPDLILIRIDAPEFDGVKTIATLTRLHPEATVLGISGINGQVQRLIERTACALGATGVLFEPLEPEHLRATVRELLAWHRG